MTATRTEQAAAAIASSSVITREDIERQQATNMPDLLRILAGVGITSNGWAGQCDYGFAAWDQR